MNKEELEKFENLKEALEEMKDFVESRINGALDEMESYMQKGSDDKVYKKFFSENTYFLEGVLNPMFQAFQDEESPLDKDIELSKELMKRLTATLYYRTLEFFLKETKH